MLSEPFEDEERVEIAQALDAGELLLDRRGDGFRERLGAGAGIAGGNEDRRRRDLGILRDGEELRRDQARQHDDDGDDAGKNRPMDEKRDMAASEVVPISPFPAA